MRPRRGRDLKGRCLSFAEREEIALARARGETMRASRPKPVKLASTLALRTIVQDAEAALLARANRRAVASPVPDDPEMLVSTETIYRSL